MPLKAVTIGAVRSWASPHTTKQLVNNQNGTIMFLSISGSFFDVIRKPISFGGEPGSSAKPAAHGSVRPTTQQILLPQINNAGDKFDCADQSRGGVDRKLFRV